MNSVTTVKRPLEAWTKAKDYLPEKKTIENLPAIPFAGVNQRIDE